MKKIVIFILVIGIAIGGMMLMQTSEDTDIATDQPSQNVEVRDGIQYITIQAKGGYSPRRSVAAAGMPTQLIVKTNGTYDCSSALVIRSIGYQKVLSPTGEEVIDLGAPQAGTVQGVCSMGMYNFSVQFQ